ncbi:MAG: type II secretion system F family protein [Rhodobacteraceae bacterium]|nr:type II secretion system F family protein [Paracoccaceae bacterium]
MQIFEALGPFGPVIVLGVLGVVLVVAAAMMIMKAPADPYSKLKTQAAVNTAPKKDALRYGNGKDKLQKYSQFLEPQDEEEYSAVKLRLMQAGYRSKNSVRTYHFAQFALGLGLLAIGALVVVVQSTTQEEVGMQKMLLTGLLPGIVGYMIPKYWVTKRLQKRQEEIENGFPDALDMMLVCVEAGQSLDQAIIRVSEEIAAGFPALAEEFAIVAHEMKAGKDKTSVLKDMSERAGVPDVGSFVTVLVQSQQFGTSIAEALRVYAGEMRDKRVMRAEEKANKLPTKMTLATMMLTVPPLLIILIGPSVWEIYLMLSQGGASVQKY